MSNRELKPFREILSAIHGYPDNCWLYLPTDEKWTLESRGAVLKSEEVPPQQEDDANAGIPDFATEKSLMQTLLVSTIQDIVENTRMQRPDADSATVFEAFIYYYDHDGFITLPRS